MKLVGGTLSDAAYVARCQLKETLQRAATILAPGKYSDTSGDLTFEQAQELRGSETAEGARNQQTSSKDLEVV